MPRVAVVFTGGTISMRHDPIAGGNVPVLGGAALLEAVPGLDTVADLVPIDRGLTPASHFSFEALFGIAATVRDALQSLVARFPALEPRVLEGDGVPSFLNVFVDGEDVRLLEGLDTPATESSTILLLPAVAGGAETS